MDFRQAISVLSQSPPFVESNEPDQKAKGIVEKCIRDKINKLYDNSQTSRFSIITIE